MYSAGANSNRMNVLLITADDLGLQLSSYGETLVETPHLDELAASGVQFDLAYVTQASCSASRSSIFTGLQPHATGQFGLPLSTWHAPFRPKIELHSSLRNKTIPNLLKAEGYRTGNIGKLHVAPQDSFQFDEWFRDEGKNAFDSARDISWIASKADVFISEAGDRPFFLMVNYSDPHEFGRREDKTYPLQLDGIPENPLTPEEVTPLPFSTIDTPLERKRLATYFNGVRRVDIGVGMLMDVIHKHELDDNTLVIFTSDHGPPFSRGKTTLYEGGLHVPFLIRWPGVSTPMRSDSMVSTLDILPTILDATGVDFGGTTHGQSLRSLLSQPEAELREYLVAEHHFHGPHPFFPRRSIRDRRYKLIHNLLAGKARPSSRDARSDAYLASQEVPYEGTPVQQAFATFVDPPEFELYDLQEDPVEFNNLAGLPAYEDVQQRLLNELQDYREQTDDPFLDQAMLRRYMENPLLDFIGNLVSP